MRDKITVYGLLSKIYNDNKDMPKKIEYDDIIWKYSNDAGDYYSERNQPFFGKNFNEMEAKVFLQSEVEIIKEDNELTIDDLYIDDRFGYQLNLQPIIDKINYLENKLNEALNEKDR